MDLIELNKISFSYSDDIPVFNSFSLCVKRGEFVFLDGENGSGKTTLFKIINGLLFPREGEYIFDGVKISKKYLNKNKNSKSFHKKIGYLFQNPDVMLFNSSVFDEIAFGPRQMGYGDEQVKKITGELADLFELQPLLDRVPYHLSSGQKKRVAFAAVLSLNPDVLTLDEPLAGLDRSSKDLFAQVISNLSDAGKTIIVAEHENEFIKNSATQTVKL